MIEVMCVGQHGATRLVREGGVYRLEGDPPDRTAMIMIAQGVLDDLTEEEREEHGIEETW